MSNFGYQVMGFGGGRQTLYKTITLGSLTQLKAVSPSVFVALRISSTKILCLYENSGIYAFVATISGATLTAGTTALLSTTHGALMSASVLEDDKVIMLSGSLALGTLASVVTVTGTTPAMASGYQINTFAGGSNPVLALSPTQCVAMINSGGVVKATTVLFSVTGNAVAIQDARTDANYYANSSRLLKVSSNLVAWITSDSISTPSTLRFTFLPVDGTSFVWPVTWTSLQTGANYITNSDLRGLEAINASSIAFAVSSASTGRCGVITYDGTMVSSVSTINAVLTGSYIDIQRITSGQYLGVYGLASSAVIKILNLAAGVLTDPYTPGALHNSTYLSGHILAIDPTHYFVVGAFSNEMQYRYVTLSS